MKLNETLTDYLIDNDMIAIRNSADDLSDEPSFGYINEIGELPVNEIPRFDENGNKLPSGPDDFAF